MLISIIVPVYNVDRFVDRCLQSLTRQGLDERDFEVILVDDGSTDCSLSICEKIAGAYNNVVLVSQDNQGVSCARNTGLDHARGDYVRFVDADDDLKEDGLSQIIGLCDGVTDLIRFYLDIISPGNQTPVPVTEQGRVLFSGKGDVFIIRYGLETFCVNYLYRRQFLLDHNITFDNVIVEDFRFISSVLLNNPRIVSTSYHIYNYWIRKNSRSTSQSQGLSRRWSYDMLETVLMLKTRLDGLREENQRLYEQGVKSLQGRLPLMFSRMLSSDLTQEEEAAIVSKCRHAGLLPLPPTGGSVKKRLSRKAVNMLARYPDLYRLARTVFVGLFLPYIKPRLDRNV